ncbi:MAG: crossover junction endodeoxyribonuclease RuvC [Gammaproteobacteria bacterium]|nr:crossover junction endodeoxyribonuclease RuvC [Gammaproteobacteria bacterium]
MRIFGVDPGSRITGYGVVDLRRGKPVYVASGCIRTPKGDVAYRLAEIFEGITSLIDTHAPDQVAVEQVFLSKNANSALKLGQARGVVLAAVARAGIDVAEYAARRVKQSVTGTGAATKPQVQHMVRVLLDLSAAPSSDAADALAIAICHINTQRPQAPTRLRHHGSR